MDSISINTLTEGKLDDGGLALPKNTENITHTTFSKEKQIIFRYTEKKIPLESRLWLKKK